MIYEALDEFTVGIIGENGEKQYAPLAVVQAMKGANVKYDIIVDEGPSSPNQRERIWSMIGEKFWDLPPPIQLALLKYSPFPESVVEEVKMAAEQASKGPQAEMAQKLTLLEAGLKQVEIQLKQAQAGKTQAETAQIASEIGKPDMLGAPQADPAVEQAIRASEAAANTETDRLRIAADVQSKADKTAADLAANREKIAAGVQTEREWMATEERSTARKSIVDGGIKLAGAALQARNKPDPKSAAKRPGG